MVPRDAPVKLGYGSLGHQPKPDLQCPHGVDDTKCHAHFHPGWSRQAAGATLLKLASGGLASPMETSDATMFMGGGGPQAGGNCWRIRLPCPERVCGAPHAPVDDSTYGVLSATSLP